jgi:aldehyde dehydrogenase (NAD+)
MQEEIFGPILPIISYRSNEEARAIIERNPNPLALYVYTSSRADEKYFTETIPFGGGCINNGIIHLGNPHIPFGGIGNSGIGAYNGRAGFEAFSHCKSLMKSSTWFDVPVWYPPHQPWHMRVLRKLLK